MNLVAVIVNLSNENKVTFRTEPPLTREVYNHFIGMNANGFNASFGDGRHISFQAPLLRNWKQMFEKMLSDAEIEVENDVQRENQKKELHRNTLAKTYGLPLE